MNTETLIKYDINFKLISTFMHKGLYILQIH